MKTPLLLVVVSALSVNVYPQGYIVLDNNGNTSTSPTASANGLFWLSTGGTPVLIHQDFNASFYAGAASNSLSPIATFLLSNGSAAGDNGTGAGYFTDPSGKAYLIANVTSSAFVQIQAWTGNFDSYAAAVAGGAAVAESPIFINPVGLPPLLIPDLTGMPAMVLSSVPEPSTFVLAGLGGLCVLLLRRRRK